MNLNGYQWFLIIVSILSALSGATAQLTDLFGAGPAHLVVTGASFLNTLITAIMTGLVGNASMADTVSRLKGVEPIRINAQATPDLAALAVNPASPFVGAATPDLRPKLQEIAKG